MNVTPSTNGRMTTSTEGTFATPLIPTAETTATEYYGIRVPIGLPTRIARGANARGMTPGEFLEYAVHLASTRQVRPHPYRIDSTLLPEAMLTPAHHEV